MRSLLFTTGCLLFMALAPHCKQEKEHPYAQQVDTMLYQLDSLNREISSGEIRRINDFSEEIRRDLSMMDSMEFEPRQVREEVEGYAALGANIDSCVTSCSAFHQEIILLESDLKSLGERMASEEAPDSLDRLISSFRKDIIELGIRIDTTLNRSMRLVEYYYLAKPRIETIKQDYLVTGSQPDEATD